jgi:hypothetical protein
MLQSGVKDERFACLLKGAIAVPDREKLIETFVRKASAIPEVQMILQVGLPGGEPRIWTVIDAPPHARTFRHKVYQAEMEAMDACAGVPADFLVLNIREITGNLEDVLPTRRRLLFQRRNVA